MLIYFIETLLCLAIFSLAYELFFRRDTFFQRNRAYLLGSLLLTLILPMLPLPQLWSWFFVQHGPTVEVGIPTRVINWYIKNSGGSPVAMQHDIPIARLILFIYLAGLFIMLTQTISQLYRIWRMMRSVAPLRNGNTRIYLCDGTASHFSFFRHIFINRAFVEGRSREFEQVLAHELAHVEQWHSLDLLLSELACIVLWFNPFSWIYHKSIQEVHEFLADREVLQSGCSKAEYQAVLVNQALGVTVFSVSNNFNRIKLKKRILMMSKIKSSNLVYWKTLVILPAFALALTLSSFRTTAQAGSGTEITCTGKVVDQQSGQALQGAVVVIQNTTNGTVTDNNGKFLIKAPEGSTLIASYVGYKTNTFSPQKSDMMVFMYKDATSIQEATVTPKNSQEGLDIPSDVLVLVDGKEVSVSYLKTADPNTIESVNVLKAETAVKSYGDKGKNGVIQITTKKADPSMAGPDTAKTGKAHKENEVAPPPPPPPPPPPHFTRDTSNSKGEVLTSKSGKPVYSSTNEKIFTVVEENATFQGGGLERFRDYVQAQVKYPELAVKNKITGKVILQFVVNSKGEVSDVKIIRGVDPSLDQAALDAIKSSPNWKPGMQSGKPVAQIFTMPIVFALK